MALDSAPEVCHIFLAQLQTSLRFGKHARRVCDGFVDRPVAGRTLRRISVDLLALS